MMEMTVKLPNDLIDEAYHCGVIHSRSVSGQIQHWYRIGKIVEENPDLPYRFIKDILLAKQEESIPFAFDEG